jgi:hypothetical protein
MKSFEREVVRLMAQEWIAADVLHRVFNASDADCDYTGVGYFLSVRDSGLSKARIVLSEPLVMGQCNGVDVGFVLFIENNELTLECHGWGAEVPADIREREVFVSIYDDGFVFQDC